MDDDADPVIEIEELKRLRDQIKNLKLENDKLRQRNLPTFSDHKPTVWTNSEPDADGITEENGDDVLADVLEIDESEFDDEETWLAPCSVGPSGVELTAWLSQDTGLVSSRSSSEDNRLYSEPRRSGIDCRTFTRRKTPARPALRFSPGARGLDSTFRVLSEPHLNLTQELRLLETSSSQDELNGTYHISANHVEEFLLSAEMDEFHLSNQREELYQSTNQTNVFQASTQRRELQTTFNQSKGSHLSPTHREDLLSLAVERSVFRAAATESEEAVNSTNRRAASCESLDDRMDDVRSMARLQEQSLLLTASTPKPRSILRPVAVAVDDVLPSPISSGSSSSGSSRTGSASNVAAEMRSPTRVLPPREPSPRVLPPREPSPRVLPPREPSPREPSPREPSPREPSPREPSAREPLPKMKPVSAAASAAAGSRPGVRTSGLPRPMSRIPGPRARKPAWADGCY